MSNEIVTLTAGFRMGKTPLILSGRFGDGTANRLTAEIGDLSMVDIASFLIRLFNDKGSYNSFPEPWGFLNKINFSGLTLIVESKVKGKGENRIGISYPFSIDVGFAQINKLEIYYYPDKKKVSMKPSGSFLGQPFEKLVKDWEIYPEQHAPEVPGYGDSLFDLKFLGLGQHLSVKDLVQSPGIADTITTLQNSFKEDAEIVPSSKAKKGDLVFDTASGWLIGSRFVVINTVDLSIIYNDPYMYGLALSLSGEKAKTFAGLNVELLYKKVTDSIGVYSLHLKLPDAMRQLEFGAVSFTLPVIDIAIYSNGNFRIDLGFPNNNDWSRVATVQVFPFIGAGGFYFALLTGATATRLPAGYDPTMGVFKPVIDFGLALRLGIGKTIDKGILKAGVSLVFQGIVTGTYGFFVAAPDSGRKDDSYYYLNGQFEVVGRVYGEINFSIISARLDVMIYAAIGMVIEAYQDIVLYVNAGVSLSLTVSINLGIINIKMDLSFSTSISYTFVLPHGDALPEWRKAGGKLLRDAATPSLNPYYTSLTSAAAGSSLKGWAPGNLRSGNKQKPVLPVWFLPQYSARLAQDVQHPELKDQKASFIAGLFLDSGTDKAAGTFGMLASAYLQWLINSSRDQLIRDKIIPATEKDSVSIQVLKELFAFLSEDTGGVPVIGYRSLTGFLYSNFDVQVTSPKEANKKLDANVSVFPMLPDLKMQVQMEGEAPFLQVDFAADKVDSSYNATIQNYFAKMKVEHQNPLEAANNKAPKETDAISQSLPVFIFQDYFILLGRNLVQDCIDLMEAYPYITEAANSIASLQKKFNISAAAIVNANANVVLKKGLVVDLGGTSYSIQKYDSFNSIAAYYNFNDDKGLDTIFLKFIADDKANSSIINLFVPGSEITITTTPPFIYTCKTGDTLESIAEKAKCTVADVIYATRERVDLLSTFVGLSIPKYEFAINEGMTFASLAAFGNISPDRFAENNAASTAALFIDKTNLVMPQLHSLPAMDLLIDGITEKNAFRKLSGLASRYLMHGLRAPAPAEFSDKKEDTYALYDLTKQLFDLPDTSAGTSCTITLSENAAASSNQEKWFKVVAAKAAKNTIESKIILKPEELQQVKSLAGTLFQPNAISVKKAQGYTLHPSRYMLKAPSVWQANAPVFVQGPSGSTWPGGPSGPSASPQAGWWPYSPAGSKGFSGPAHWQRAVAPKIWYFSDELTKAVQEKKALEPQLKLYMGKNNMVEKKFDKKAVYTYGWSTIIPLKINQVPSSFTQGEMLSTMFEIESTSEEGLQLLENLIINQYDPALKNEARVDVGQVHILYTPADSSNGSGLRSIEPTEVIAAVVQSNLSTVRNPQALRSAAGSVGKFYGSLNQDPVTNLRRLWEACSVRSGGFYLHYFDNNTQQGIPANVFDEKGHAEISILVTYGLQHQYGYNFLNSMTLGEMVPEDAYLFVESQERQINTVSNDTTVESLLTDYRLTLEKIAEALGDKKLKEGTALSIRSIIFVLDTDDYTLETLAKKFNVSADAISHLNAAIELKKGYALRIPPVAYTVGANETLTKIAAAHSVSVISLLWGNKQQSLFSDLSGLALKDQSQHKTSSVIPGTVSFDLLRKNPEPITTTAFDPQATLQLNYNLLTFAVKKNASFAAGSYSMPLSPGNNGWTGASGSSPYLNYQGVIPAVSYSQKQAQKGMPAYPAPEKNPYRSAGDVVQLHFDWQDMYGNRTVSPFNAPQLYPQSPELNNFSQLVTYSDPLQSVLQWPGIGIDHLFVKNGNGAGLNVSLRFDASGYQPLKGKGSSAELIKKAQADLETYRKAIYQLSADDVKASVSTSLDPAPEEQPGLKPALLHMMEGIFHYLSGFAAKSYTHFKVQRSDPAALASHYRLSGEYIRALNPPDAAAPVSNELQDYFLPNDNFYLYYTLAGESLEDVAAKLKECTPFENITAEKIRALNRGVPEVPGSEVVIVIPDHRFITYEATEEKTLTAIAVENGVSAEVLKAANPGIDSRIATGEKILIPYFSGSIYKVQEGDTLEALATAFHVPVSVLNAATSRHTMPLQAGTSILVPDVDFKLYTVKAGDTLQSVATENWLAYEIVRRINPGVTSDLSAGTTLLLPKTPLPLIQSFDVKFDPSLAPVIPLEVAISISRQPDRVEDAFLDQPEVSISKCLVPPHLSASEQNKNYRGATPAANTASLLFYAESFENAFTDLKIATLGDKSASKNQLYAVRLHEQGLSADKKMISYNFVKDNAVFYAPIPLSTYPLGATFGIPIYKPGAGFTGAIGGTGWGTTDMTFQGIQLDNIAENLFESVDQLLQPDLTKALVEVDGILGTQYRGELLEAKKKIAQGYTHLVQPVLAQSGTEAPADAKGALEQQMLQRLCNLYSIGTIVQLPVSVSSPYTEKTSLIFGNPVSDEEDKKQSRVSFSSAQVSLQQSDTARMTFILNAVQPAKNKNLSLNLAYKPLAMEFNIHPIPGIREYQASQWLFFVKPLQQVPIGNIRVPLPLRDFPVPPTPMGQEAKGVNDADPGTLTLEQTRQWQYAFTFRNPDTAAAQDLIYSSTLFNIETYNLRSAANLPDLFLGLSAWNVIGRDIMADLLRLLPALKPGDVETTGSDLAACREVLTSYLKLVNYVASAIPVWLDVRVAKKYQPQNITSAGANNAKNALEFQVIRAEEKEEEANEKSSKGKKVKKEKEADGDFYIQLKAPEVNAATAAPYPLLPQINKGNYKPTLKDRDGKTSPQKYFFVNENGDYLQTKAIKENPASNEISLVYGAYPAERPDFGQWLNIMEQWNAWGGVYIMRNQYLFETGGQATNPNFVYRTPVVRPYNAAAPLLDYDAPFDLHNLPLPAVAETFDEQLRNMLFNFLGAKENTAPKVRLKLVWSYSYCINAESTDPDGPYAQYVTLPGGLIPPFEFIAPADWKNKPAPDSFAAQLASVISEWLRFNQVPGEEAGARILFDITAFSNLPDNKLPFYRLRNLFLYRKDLLPKQEKI